MRLKTVNTSYRRKAHEIFFYQGRADNEAHTFRQAGKRKRNLLSRYLIPTPCLLEVLWA
jgi:hypothetical protein